MIDQVKKVTDLLEKELANQKSKLLTCTAAELANIQVKVRYCQGLLKMIASNEAQEKEINFDE